MVAIHRFVEKADRTGLYRGRTQPLFRMRAHENNGYAVAVGEQAAVQIESSHARHLDVGNQAGGIGNVTATEAIFGRGESLGIISQMLNEMCHRLANRFIIIDDENLGTRRQSSAS